MLLHQAALFLFPLLSQGSGNNGNSGSASGFSATWTGYGGSIFNQRWASQNKDITSANVKTLTTHCNVHYNVGGISATPSISGNIAYYPTWAGALVAFDYTRCKTVWTLNVTKVVEDFAPPSTLQVASSGALASRTSPTVDGDILYFGTLVNALLVAVDKNTGRVLGRTQVNPHELAIVTMAPTVYNGKIFVGSSSTEEGASIQLNHTCCSFIGNVAAYSFDKSRNKFTTLWDIPMIPQHQAEAGWSGVAVWGSNPPIDTVRNQVIFGTGNAYSVPDIITQCQNETANIPAVAQGLVSDPCLPKDILTESVIAIDIDLGIINWVYQLPALDSWVVACGIPGSPSKTKPSNCPERPGPDVDFGMAPVFVPGSENTPYGKDTIVIGQKSGALYTLSAQAGELFWVIMTNPGGLGGGLSWGISVDDSQVYYTAINSNAGPWTIEPSGIKTNSSAYGSASLKDGTFLWGIPVPGGGTSYGPPTAVGDVVLVARTGTNNDSKLVAIQKHTGKILDTWEVNGLFRGGVSVQDNSVLFGTGYGGFAGPLTPGNLTVLTLKGH
ncbi:quinon protein alcohol dehydrogenase-like superfamily [Xylogone sp. PMI_703]|nr:quinon protein alcohol dehydrogenase-like superfamily [Xylogone sp. PMI_703]